MAGAGLLDLSPDLVKIRPIYLEDDHLEELATRWRECCCCREPLNEQAVQIECCGTMYHVHCVRNFAKSKALVLKETGERLSDFFCPWCNTVLNCRPSDVWAFLDESAIEDVLEVGEHLDQWLASLSKLTKDARGKFMNLAADYESLVGDPSAAVRLPAKVYAVRKLCQSEPSALKAFDTLYKERRSSFDALLAWKEWLAWDDDLEREADLINAETMFGHGPNRFVPRIVERLRQD